MQTKILIAIADENDSTILAAYLEQKGYLPTIIRSGSKIVEFFKSGNYDFCILDVQLDGADGIEVAREIRVIDSEVPIMFLTASIDDPYKIAAFEAGADDYVTRPFNMEELLLRIAAILRRCYKEDNDETFFQIGKFAFDYNKQLLVFDKTTERRLTTKESDLLRLFALNEDRVVERKTALQKIWKDSSFYNARSMDVYITKLRKYLALDPDVEILNVHSVGFRLLVSPSIQLKKKSPAKKTTTTKTAKTQTRSAATRTATTGRRTAATTKKK